jgi:hypothetical protein
MLNWNVIGNEHRLVCLVFWLTIFLRLRQKETELRKQLNDTCTRAREREAELLAEVHMLSRQLQQRISPNYTEVGMLDRSSHSPPHISLFKVAFGTEPLDPFLPVPATNATSLLDNEGEQSMQLATPLLPTSILMNVPDDVNMPLHATRSPPPFSLPINRFAPGTVKGEILRETYAPDPVSEIESPHADPPTIPHSPELEVELEDLIAWEENSTSISASFSPRFPSPSLSSASGHSDVTDILQKMG